MTLNKQQATELYDAISRDGLKARHISGDNFNKLILDVMPKLKKAMKELTEQEIQIMRAMEGVNDGKQIHFKDSDTAKMFTEQIEKLHKEFSLELTLNFIPHSELKEFTKEQDASITAIIFEYMEQK